MGRSAKKKERKKPRGPTTCYISWYFLKLGPSISGPFSGLICASLYPLSAAIWVTSQLIFVPVSYFSAALHSARAGPARRHACRTEDHKFPNRRPNLDSVWALGYGCKSLAPSMAASDPIWKEDTTTIPKDAPVDIEYDSRLCGQRWSKSL